MVSDANNDGCSCNKFQYKLHPHVTCPRETSRGHLEQNLLEDIAGTTENPILKKAGEQMIAETTHRNADGGRKSVLASVSAEKVGKV